MRESAAKAYERWRKLKYLQKAYASFPVFLEDCMAHLGFNVTWMQNDIAKFIDAGDQSIMVQSQRSEAKTTITAIYAVYTLIQAPTNRILIISSGEKTSNQISTLILKIIQTMEQLECMRPDRQSGDRTSVEGFDVHYTLKGIEKSPSVACVGITGSFTGYRADLIIADDIESSKNSNTQRNRNHLIESTSEFSDIIDVGGRIIYLGTPHTVDSIYNRLPSMGFIVRIWPGRYPTKAQIGGYGEHLAPSIVRALERDPSLAEGGGMALDQGKPTDPHRLDEIALQRKELEKTTSRFQLQYMLNTSLADINKFPLKTDDLIVMNLDKKLFPMTVTRNPSENSYRKRNVCGHSFMTATAWDQAVGGKHIEYAPLSSKIMYVDPAGGGRNNDETAYCVLGFLNSNVFLLDVGGVPGGYSRDLMEALAKVAKDNLVNKVIIEKNFGYGAFREIFFPVLTEQYECAIEDDMVSGQKEKRIEGILAPVMARSSLVVSEDVIAKDEHCCARYSPSEQKIFSLFFQMSKLTLERNSLMHDDRLDCLAGAVGHFVDRMSIDEKEEEKRKMEADLQAWLEDPLQRNRYSTVGSKRCYSLLDKYR